MQFKKKWIVIRETVSNLEFTYHNLYFWQNYNMEIYFLDRENYNKVS